jgi:hypothetical protein
MNTKHYTKEFRLQAAQALPALGTIPLRQGQVELERIKINLKFEI